jgi:GABA permease
VLSLVLMLALTATNLVSARSFGEFEYWFSSIKVVAIVVFLGLGVLWITGLWPHSTPGLANLVAHGGFIPLGWGAVLAAVVPCAAFYTGAEIVTIAAAESEDPEGAVRRAMKSIVARIILFYVGSIFVVVTVQPWNTKSVGVSPYASVLSVLSVLNIPAVTTIMNVIVLTAVLSCLNSALYTTSRMVFALTTQGDGPRFFTKLSGSGVPRRAILLGTTVGYVSVAATYIWGDVVFNFLVNSYGAVALFVYIIIAISQVVLRRRARSQDVAVPVAELRHHCSDGRRHPGDGIPAEHAIAVRHERRHVTGGAARLRGAALALESHHRPVSGCDCRFESGLERPTFAYLRAHSSARS